MQIINAGANVILTTRGIDDVSMKYMVETGAWLRGPTGPSLPRPSRWPPGEGGKARKGVGRSEAYMGAEGVRASRRTPHRCVMGPRGNPQ